METSTPLPLLQHTVNIKANMGKKQSKSAVKPKNQGQQKQGSKIASSKPANNDLGEQLLFQRLAHDMVDQLMLPNHVNTATESLDLLNRLSATTANLSGSATDVKTTTTSTTTMRIVLEDSATCIADCPPTEMTNTPDSNPAKQHQQSPVGHLSAEALSKFKNVLPELVRAKHSADHHHTSTATSRANTHTFTLDDFAAMVALESLVERFGRVSHMGILDKSYTFFVSRARDAALYFKVKNNIAVIGGDPLCKQDLFPKILEEFAEYRRKHHLDVAFLGASEDFMRYAKEQKWVTMQFGMERVLNPMTNPVLLENGGKTGKRMTKQNKQLLDPKKGGLTVEVYSPSISRNDVLQEQLVGVYDAWRDHRNRSGVPQAYITVYDPFALPDLMTYIYTKDRNGTPNGFAALRKLGANNGYHVDPCIAAPSAPSGVTDLLIFASMALLNKAGISYLSFGFEPLDDLGEITGMPKSMTKVTKMVHKQIFGGLKVGGKKNYHAKFQPDETQQSALYLVFPDGTPGVRHMSAMVHIANISLRQLVVTKMRKTSVIIHNHTITNGSRSTSLEKDRAAGQDED